MLLDLTKTRNMALSPVSESFGKWNASPVDVLFSVYLFNVTNPYEIRHGAKAKLNEVGPYIFSLKHYKKVYRWNDTLGEVHYNLTTVYRYVANKTSNMRQRITFFNVPFLMGANNVLDKFGSTPGKLDEMTEKYQECLKYEKVTLFEYRSVRELLFEGYNSDTMKGVRAMEEDENAPPRYDPRENYFSLLGDKNNTQVGPLISVSGKKGMTHFNWIKSYHDKKNLRLWKSKYCNQMNGTDGLAFPPGITEKDKLYIFDIDICKSVYLQFEKAEDLLGIETFKFVMAEDVFEDPRKSRETECYCLKDQIDDCPKKGIFHMRPCTGQPLFYSGPHFHECAKDYIENVEGMKPNGLKHKFLINVNPATGLVFRYKKVAQINIQLPALHKLSLLEKVKPALIPLYWYKEEAIVDNSNANQFREMILEPIRMGYIALVISVCVGIAALCAFAIVALLYLKKLGNQTTSDERESPPQQRKYPASETIDISSGAFMAELRRRQVQVGLPVENFQ